MKLSIMSDSHGWTPEIPDADLLIHCGDALSRGTMPELLKFNRWLGDIRQRYQAILYVPGNHDRIIEQNPSLCRELLTNATLLLDQEIYLLGLKFWGSPYTRAFNNWAFQLYTDEEARKYWAKIPYDVDVLITHGPPRGILDKTPRGESVGCPELLQRVLQLKPRIHAFGHIHGSHGQQFVDGTQFINASICDETYSPSNLPIVVELEP